MTKVTIIGITHIDSDSHDKVTRILEKLKPDAICLELDQYRLDALLENERADMLLDHREIEIRNDESLEVKEPEKSLIFEQDFAAILEDIGFFESELAHITTAEQPGKEMLIAYKKAKEMNIEIFLIDKSIHDISRILEEEVSSEEGTKFQHLIDELMYDKKIVAKPLEQSDKQISDPLKNFNDLEEKEEINLNEVIEIFKDQESLQSILSVFHFNFPQLYSVLLEDRNVFMANQILKIAETHTNLVVILGYGHVQEVARYLRESNKKHKVEVLD